GLSVKTVNKRDFVLGLVVCALALFVLFGILPWAVKTPKVIPNLALSPTFWPRIILVSLVGLSAFLAIQALYEGIKPRDAVQDESYEEPFDLSDFRVIPTALLMVLFCAALKPFGVVLPAIAMLLGMIVMHGRKEWPKAIGVSIATVLILYMFFRYVAKVPVPLGPLNGLL
ncbi:tripartite tricarboxylate transporter TctB family protein, partial [Roseovarius sp.]